MRRLRNIDTMTPKSVTRMAATTVSAVARTMICSARSIASLPRDSMVFRSNASTSVPHAAPPTWIG